MIIGDCSDGGTPSLGPLRLAARPGQCHRAVGHCDTDRPQARARAWHSGLALTGRPPGPGHDSESRGSLSARASRGGSLSAAAAGAAAHPAAGHSVIVAVIVTDSESQS